MTERRVRIAFGVVAALLACYALLRIELSTDITSFMPRESDAELAVLASRLADSELTRTMILTIGSETGDLDAAVSAARELARALEGHPEVATLSNGVDPDQLEAIYRLHFPRRYYFLSEEPEREIPRRTSDAALRERAREVKRSLALPSATLTRSGDGVGA